MRFVGAPPIVTRKELEPCGEKSDSMIVELRTLNGPSCEGGGNWRWRFLKLPGE
jgi:hypothetical protein